MARDRWLKTALPIVLAALAVVDAPRPVAAQPFGWFFGGEEPPQRYGARRRQPPRRARPQRYLLEDVPLPVPRPHFPGDPPTGAATRPEPAQQDPARSAGKTAGPDKPAPGREPDIAAPAEKKPLPDETAPPPVEGEGAPLPPQRPPEAKLKPADTAPAPPKPAEMAKPSPPAEVKPNVEAKPAEPGKSAEPAQPASPPAASAPVPTPPPKPPDLAKPDTPGVAPSGARLGEAPGQPDDDATCQDRLKARDVEIEPLDIGPQPDPRCTVVRALRLKGLTLPGGAKVSFPEKPTIACTTADAFSSYVHDLLSPLAKGTFGAPVASVWTGPGLECRSRDHVFGAKLSAHGQGLAIDIAQLKLADGKMIEVGNAKDETGQAFETAARNAACGYFHTVLGPGSDSYHRTHWHFDLEVRGAKGDSKYCK